MNLVHPWLATILFLLPNIAPQHGQTKFGSPTFNSLIPTHNKKIIIEKEKTYIS